MCSLIVGVSSCISIIDRSENVPVDSDESPEHEDCRCSCAKCESVRRSVWRSTTFNFLYSHPKASTFPKVLGHHCPGGRSNPSCSVSLVLVPTQERRGPNKPEIAPLGKEPEQAKPEPGITGLM